MRDRFGRLKQLTVKGFKSIREIDALELTDINIVIGQNGAGKSNLVSLFRFMAKVARKELSDYMVKQGGLNKILYFGPKVTHDLKILLKSDSYEYSMTLEPTAKGMLTLTDEFLAHSQDDKITSVYRQNTALMENIITNDIASVPTIIKGPIEEWRGYHFHDTSENSPLRSSAHLTEPERLAADGGNLAAFLYFLQER